MEDSRLSAAGRAALHRAAHMRTACIQVSGNVTIVFGESGHGGGLSRRCHRESGNGYGTPRCVVSRPNVEIRNERCVLKGNSLLMVQSPRAGSVVIQAITITSIDSSIPVSRRQDEPLFRAYSSRRLLVIYRARGHKNKSRVHLRHYGL